MVNISSLLTTQHRFFEKAGYIIRVDECPAHSKLGNLNNSAYTFNFQCHAQNSGVRKSFSYVSATKMANRPIRDMYVPLDEIMSEIPGT